MSNWVVVYKTNNPNQSQIVKSVLEDNEVDVVIMDKTGSMLKEIANAVELHVKPEDVIKAKYIISKNSL